MPALDARRRLRALPALLLALMFQGCGGEQAPDAAADALPGIEVIAELVPPPGVPQALDRSEPATVIVNLETNEQTMRLAEGVDYTFWTFGGSVPGPLIRVRVGDRVEFRLSNHPSSQNPHNIDLHAVNGPGGGAVSSLVAPGRSATFAFKALNPGLYQYHCATAPVGMHVANGMYGLILVEPEEGLPPVDREYYVMQGEFYTAGAYGSPGLQPFDMQKAMAEDPPYVVFNGGVGALSGTNALTAEAGETVRLFVGNGGPNLSSSFHVIGEIFDRVWVEAGTMVNENVQTTMIPAGGAAIVEFETNVPGDFLLVDHALFRAFNKGALAILDVGGADGETVYSGQITEGVYEPEGGAIQSFAAAPPPPTVAASVEERITLGSAIYTQSCVACHQATGTGLGDVFPPVAGSDYLNANVARAIRTVTNGLSGPITVNGIEYQGQMPPLGLTDEQVANVLTYVYSQWGNSGAVVTPEEVRAARFVTVPN
ncbi:MAG: copper-containing nitrite reductase [Gemmatimonadota bacterium]